MADIRQRRGKSVASSASDRATDSAIGRTDDAVLSHKAGLGAHKGRPKRPLQKRATKGASSCRYDTVNVILTISAAAIRFIWLNYPNEVVYVKFDKMTQVRTMY
jgi:hypothetical protein